MTTTSTVSSLAAAAAAAVLATSAPIERAEAEEPRTFAADRILDVSVEAFDRHFRRDNPTGLPDSARFRSTVDRALGVLRRNDSGADRYSYVVGKEKYTAFIFGGGGGAGTVNLAEGGVDEVFWRLGPSAGLTVGSYSADVLIIARHGPSAEDLQNVYGKLVKIGLNPPPSPSTEVFRADGVDIAVIRHYAKDSGIFNAKLFDHFTICSDRDCEGSQARAGTGTERARVSDL